MCCGMDWAFLLRIRLHTPAESMPSMCGTSAVALLPCASWSCPSRASVCVPSCHVTRNVPRPTHPGCVLHRREAENMGGCGMDGLMYKKVQPCDFLCHPYAADLIMLTVEVLADNLEVSILRHCLGPVQPWCQHM